ncbi:MAG TPA: hypothetical protein PLB51_00065 [Candidatus Paceibacterota bacterium]|jgi:hypothetical protein|nr:hypothetical protein [Candidatus Paceibacterota bacterium]
MSPEEKDLLKRTFELAKENNALLLKMKKAVFLGTVMKVVYYGLILGSFFGAYYLIQPYLESFVGSVEQGSNDMLHPGSLLNNTLDNLKSLTE